MANDVSNTIKTAARDRRPRELASPRQWESFMGVLHLKESQAHCMLHTHTHTLAPVHAHAHAYMSICIYHSKIGFDAI